MATIALKGMRFHGFHGHYTEEQSVGNNYEIDVTIQTDIQFTTLDDDLTKTLNYELVYQICKKEMGKPCRLIETLAQNILAQLRTGLGSFITCKVAIRKMNPLLGGLVDFALIEVEG